MMGRIEERAKEAVAKLKNEGIEEYSRFLVATGDKYHYSWMHSSFWAALSEELKSDGEILY